MRRGMELTHTPMADSSAYGRGEPEPQVRVVPSVLRRYELLTWLPR